MKKIILPLASIFSVAAMAHQPIVPVTVVSDGDYSVICNDTYNGCKYVCRAVSGDECKIIQGSSCQSRTVGGGVYYNPRLVILTFPGAADLECKVLSKKK